jgi:hypothetical protein
VFALYDVRRIVLSRWRRTCGFVGEWLANWVGFCRPRARVQAHRLSSVHEGVPRAMDHHSLGCLPAEKFPTFASGRQGRGATTLSDFRLQFHLTRSRDVAGGRITGIRGWICATSSLGSPVIIVQVRTHSPDSGSFQFSQSPAKGNGLWENWKSEPASK